MNSLRTFTVTAFITLAFAANLVIGTGEQIPLLFVGAAIAWAIALRSDD